MLTGDGQRPAGYAVVLVFLVGIGAPQAQTGQKSSEEVGEANDDDEGGRSSNVTGPVSPAATRDGLGVERQRGRRVNVDTLLEKTLAESVRNDPFGGRRGRDHQKRGDRAAREGDNLQFRPSS